jgi:hypothetical protein
MRVRAAGSARGALRGDGAGRHDSLVVIASVQPVRLVAWPAGWEDVEVVDSVLVDVPPPAPDAVSDARVYDRSGRVPAFARLGRLVSVVA